MLSRTSKRKIALGLGFVRLMSGFQARLFEVEVVLDAVHGLVADHALVAQFDQGPALCL